MTEPRDFDLIDVWWCVAGEGGPIAARVIEIEAIHAGAKFRLGIDNNGRVFLEATLGNGLDIVPQSSHRILISCDRR